LHTDVVEDSHRLPSADEVFDVVIALNVFEHYRDPRRAATEIWRVLRLGGMLLMRTAFLQSLHEPCQHFYNYTEYGLLGFQDFQAQQGLKQLQSTYSLAWLLRSMESALS
jgi:2-polyprenyl-3-methyl-5-hydroxy-6-metoxy-1,4-benzoquinol methylase